MSDTVTKSKNVTESRECGDAVTTIPRPWLIEKLEQLDGKLDEAVAIHEALVAERDRLRDIVRQMADMLDHVSREYRFDFNELVREARAAIGEDRP